MAEEARRKLTPQKAFALGVEDFKRRHVDDDDLQWNASESLDRLTTDIRMQGVWEKLNGDAELIQEFLDVVFAIVSVSAIGIAQIRADHDELVRELHEVEDAIEVLSQCCKDREDLPQHLRDLEPALRELGELELSRIAPLLKLIALFLPTSRKSRVDFIVRTHFPWLMVRQMKRLFGQPHYEVVANTLNVFFGQEPEITPENVRDAYRRRAGDSSPRFPIQ
jgi:hypothetical protein